MLKGLTKNKSSLNVLSISIGQFGSLVISFFSVSLTARFLGVEEYGKFNYLLSIVFIASKISDLGLSNIIFRETAKSKDGFNYINVGLTVRIISLLLVAVILNFTFFLSNSTIKEVFLLNIFLLSTIFSSRFMVFRDLLDIPFKVNLEMIYSNLLTMMDNLLFLVLILLLPYFKAGLEYVVLSYVFSNIPGFLLTQILLKKKYKFNFRFSLNDAKWMIKQSLPLAGFLVMISLFNQMDIFLLTYLDSEKSTGIYSVASRLIIPLAILPTAIATTFFPKVVSNFNNSLDNSFIYNLINKVMLLFSISLALVVSFKAKDVIVLIFGNQYEEAFIPSIFLMWSCVFLFFSYLTLDFFTAANKQKYNLLFSLLIALLSFFLLIYFIPLYSYNAPGAIKLFVSLIGAVFILFNLSKVNLRISFFDLTVFKWILLSTVSLYLLSFLPLFLYFLFSLVLIIILTLKIHFFSRNELLLLLNKLNVEYLSEKLLRW